MTEFQTFYEFVNIGRSMFDVRCSTFKAYSPPLEDSLFRPGGVSYKRLRRLGFKLEKFGIDDNSETVNAR